MSHNGAFVIGNVRHLILQIVSDDEASIIWTTKDAKDTKVNRTYPLRPSRPLRSKLCFELIDTV